MGNETETKKKVPSATEILDPALVRLNLDVASAETVIEQLGALLEENGYVKSSFVEGVLTRERSQPTGLPLEGDLNVAIPHTDVEHVHRPGLAVATLNSTVPFRNMANPDEEVPVSIVIVMALNQPKAQVQMLRELATFFQDPERVRAVYQAGSPQEVVNVLRSFD